MRLNGVDNQANCAPPQRRHPRQRGACSPSSAGPGGVAADGRCHPRIGGRRVHVFPARRDRHMQSCKARRIPCTRCSDTGGKALLDVNDLGRGILNAQEALSSY